jgi:hypothetical protein
MCALALSLADQPEKLVKDKPSGSIYRSIFSEEKSVFYIDPADVKPR